MSEENRFITLPTQPGTPLCSFCGTQDGLGYTLLAAPDHPDRMLLFTCGPCGAMVITEVLHALTDGQRKAWFVGRFPQLYPTPTAEAEKPKRRRKR